MASARCARPNHGFEGEVVRDPPMLTLVCAPHRLLQ
jgi:hypothetical protein